MTQKVCSICVRPGRADHPKCLARAGSPAHRPAQAPAHTREGQIRDLSQSQRDVILGRINKQPKAT